MDPCRAPAYGTCGFCTSHALFDRLTVLRCKINVPDCGHIRAPTNQVEAEQWKDTGMIPRSGCKIDKT